MNTYTGTCRICGKTVTVTADFFSASSFTCNMNEKSREAHHTRQQVRDSWLTPVTPTLKTA